MFLQQERRRRLRNNLWVRSAGKCECTSSCEHHKPGRCGIALNVGFFYASNILPADPNAGQKESMMEALCEACRMNPGIKDQAAEESGQGHPNSWYRRRRAPRSQALWLAA